MTASLRGWMPRLVTVLALLLFGWSHRHVLQLGGFADDLGLLIDLPVRLNNGTLVTDVVARLFGPLWPGSNMWRPIPYASFALDALLWGNSPGLWRISNVLLHIATAGFTGLLALRLLGDRFSGAAAFSVVLLAPWSPEVAIWLVGRFDGWATLFIVIAVWTGINCRGVDRWLVASVVAGIAAYMSKESALILPVWILIGAAVTALQHPELRVAQAAKGSGHAARLMEKLLHVDRSVSVLLLTHLLLAALYLSWRTALFAGNAVSVYAGEPEYRLLPLLGRITSHLTFATGIAPLQMPAAVMITFIGLVSIPLALQPRTRAIAIAAALLVLSVMVAVSVHFSHAPGASEGYRLYYLATVGLALLLAAALSDSGTAKCMLLITLMLALAAWQSRVAAEWTRASRYLDAARAAIPAVTNTMARSDFGLLLLADSIGHVPAARNAQGAILNGIAGRAEARDFLIVFTPPQMTEWHQLAQEDVVAKLTLRKDAPARPTRFYCFDAQSSEVKDLGYWAGVSVDDWTTRWRDAVSKNCPDQTF